MRKLKKAFSFVLALAMCLGLMAVPTAAEWVGDFEVSGDTLVKYYGDGGAVTIPDGITTIGVGAFRECTGLTSVTIPNGVTTIENSAFVGCKGLTSVAIPNSITAIGEGVFENCTGLTGVTIPNSVTSMGNVVFTNCTSLTSVTIPNSVTTIGRGVFDGCTSLTSVTIPNSVTRIDKEVFRGCTNLTSVTIPSSVTALGDWAFADCTGLTSVTILSGEVHLGGFRFNDCTSLTDVYYIGSNAQWKERGGEEGLTYNKINPTVHFNSTGPSTTQPTTPVQPQQPAGTTASPTNDKLEVNGSAADPTVYKIGGSNYFKIRDVAALLSGTEKQFAVGYDGSKNAVTATTGQGYEKQSDDLAGAAKGGNQAAAASNDAVYVDGQKITAEVYKINGSNYFKLRDLGKALNFYVGWSAERGMYIETDKPYSE